MVPCLLSADSMTYDAKDAAINSLPATGRFRTRISFLYSHVVTEVLSSQALAVSVLAASAERTGWRVHCAAGRHGLGTRRRRQRQQSDAGLLETAAHHHDLAWSHATNGHAHFAGLVWPQSHHHGA